MGITQTLYVTNSQDWRNWLKTHYKSEKEIWLVYYKKETGKPRISYNDAVSPQFAAHHSDKGLMLGRWNA